jgi:hypothetical protein
MFHFQGRHKFNEQKTQSQIDLWDFHLDLLKSSSDAASCWIIANYSKNKFAGSLLQQYCRSGKLSDKQWAAAGKAAKR